MPLSPEQRQRVLEAITSGRLRLDPPKKMYAGYGDGHECSGCGEVIDRKQVEWEATYENGQAYRLHLGCAGLWDVERRRRQQSESASVEPQRARAQSQAVREQAQATSKDSAQLRDRADVLAREAEAIIEEARRVKRGEPPGELGSSS
jgi:hypothetical protein